MKKFKNILVVICSCSLIVSNFAQAVKIKRRNSKLSNAVSRQLVRENSKKIKKQLKKSKNIKNNKSNSKIDGKTVKNATVPIVKNGVSDNKKNVNKNDRYFSIIRKMVSGYRKKYRKKMRTVGKVSKWGTLSALGLGATSLAVNQGIRLNMLYEIAEQNENIQGGRGCSSVKVYKYRDQDDEDKKDKELVVKKINYLSPGIFAFGSEKKAKKALDGFKGNKDNELNEKDKEILDHFANVLDYHYGLTSAYVVYEKVNNFKDWKSELIRGLVIDRAKTKKFLANVFTQVLDCSDFLYRHGLLHGDLDFHNYSIDNVSGKPFVHIYDYGMLHRIKDNPYHWESFNAELDKILKGFIVLYCYYFNIGNVDLNDKDAIFKFIISDEETEKYKSKLLQSNDKNLKLLVNMYLDIQNTFKFCYALRGSRPIGLKYNFTKEEFEQKIRKLREIIANMAS